MTHPIWHASGLSPAEVKKILSDPKYPRFGKLAASLLSATLEIKELSRWISPRILAENYDRKIRRHLSQGRLRHDTDLIVRAIQKQIPGVKGRKDRVSEVPSLRAYTDSQVMGQRLRGYRRDVAKLSAQNLAKRMGVSRQRALDIEKGRSSMTLNTLFRYIEAAGGSVSIQLNSRSLYG
ncbi:MAG: helix-turn-helix transcriptional regulator [Deltaproteobacteria bacterium]|nr:helix-turn-helix transcriptional regulator [Deltaproteobacteria bacterium]